jgi:hypothetical protein
VTAAFWAGLSSFAGAVPPGLRYSDYHAVFIANSGSNGWTLTASGMVQGDDIPAQSALRIVLRQGTTELARIFCQADSLVQRHLGYEIAAGQVGRMEVDRCNDRSVVLQATGEIQLDVLFVDGGDDSETLLRTHVLDVRRTLGPSGVLQYYVAHNAELASSVIYECDAGSYACVQDQAAGQGRVGLVFWAAAQDENGVESGQDAQPEFGPNLTQLRCSVDGRRLEITEPIGFRQISNEQQAARHVTGAGTPDKRIDYSFQRYRVSLPIEPTEGREAPAGWVTLAGNDGAWSCDMRIGGETIRSFRFQVSGGHVAPHPEEIIDGGVRLPWRTHLVEMTIPGGRFETRVDASLPVARGPFYGLGWRSAEGRAAAGALPRLGELYLPSDAPARGEREAPAGGRPARRRR